MKNHENTRTSVGYIRFGKKEGLYFVSSEIQASHKCPLKNKQWFEQNK